MKYLICVLSMFAVCACNVNFTPTGTESKVIKEVIVNAPFDIFFVKGHEYLATTQGGILHTESCICKAKKEN